MVVIAGMVVQPAAADGHFVVRTVARNAVRIQYVADDLSSNLPDWVYVKNETVESDQIAVSVDEQNNLVTVKNANGDVVFTAVDHQLNPATLAFVSLQDEYLFGLGQFQDGYSNVRGLSRRLTQVNTQISIPMLISGNRLPLRR